ncbi:MAG: 23S rRNA (adenine(2503)-C(2))-methyltransferase RlmN, partial [Oscillospiraceae bacterium]
REMGLPAFRSKQLFTWLHQKQAANFSEMLNLPVALRQQLAQNWAVDAPVVSQKQESKDGTVKYLLRLADGNHVEAVLMKYRYGNTLCVSSQVGCRMGCRFCASTQGGLVRNLTAGEMAGELYTVQRDSGQPVSHIVLMGIGEPLDNFGEVVGFIRLATHPGGQNLSIRNISLSTCGLVPAIQKLAELRLGLMLSVSLHAPNDETRSSMMPVNNRYPIAQLMQACRSYQQQTGRRISFEYAMVQGVNDSPAHAKQLAGLLRGMGAHINLIPINPVDGSPFGPSQQQNIEEFRSLLEKLGMNATVRRRLGTDINAACGQLRQQAAKEKANEG